MPDAHDQWVNLMVTNSLGSRIRVRNAHLSWGKFYKNGSKTWEVSPEEVSQFVILPASEHSISSCGRGNSPSGTEGTIDLYDDTTKVATLYWNCPWGPTNNFEVRDVNQGYIVTNGRWNETDDALGNIAINVALNE
ncbi:putative Asp-hemolysin precursor [Leucogyrophana mollusca]|uniref:Asp-hemolysin n=1 Tax=Leucogyrophana mollusca TaxID=85980 RepID=A0ACB8B393_9AGAM|nr:putative Asp-hemolysin precursor [Leucogyrophana mollusca]